MIELGEGKKVADGLCRRRDNCLETTDAYLRGIAKEFKMTVQAVYQKIPKQDRVYLDENGINRYLKREYARQSLISA